MLTKRTGGFTLFELIVTIVIIAIITLLAVPSFKSLMASREAKKTTQLLISAVQLARSQSATHRTNVVICSSGNGTNCQTNQWSSGFLMFLDKNKNGTADTDEKIILTELNTLKYGKLSWGGTTTVITFRKPNGLPVGSNGTFTYCSDFGQQNHNKIYLNDMGLTRKENPANC